MNWYPGHMAKALREIKEHIKKVDIIYLLLDSRCPITSMNPTVLEVIKDKPTLYIYNKSSLTDLSALKPLITQEHYVIVDALKRRNLREIISKTKEICASLLERQIKRGYKNYPLKAMILGIPNVGKSTLANALSNKRTASTDAKPGHTKALQWIKIDESIQLLDTPGMLWPKLGEPKVGYHLSLAGSIKETLLNKETLAYYAYNFLKEYYPACLHFYRLPHENALTFFETLMNERGLNEHQAYTVFLNDIKNGVLGGLCFDVCL